MKCWICNRSTLRRKVVVRGGKYAWLNDCRRCDFQFFNHDNTTVLRGNRLDQTRLKRAGLAIPPRDEDYSNGLKQSQAYVQGFLQLPDRQKNILEIGCSWGYFLAQAQKLGVHPWGLEINPIRSNYVRTKLKIPCYEGLESIEAIKIQFRKIFLFYSLEYIPEPVRFLKRLFQLLEVGGQLVIITPNLRDVLKDVWCNPGFIDFFYDETAVSYYSYKAVNQLLKGFKRNAYVRVHTEQGYSMVNHLSWYLTQKPRTTGWVGGDTFVSGIVSLLSRHGDKMGKELSKLIKRHDLEYRRCIENRQLGNRVIATIEKR